MTKMDRALPNFKKRMDGVTKMEIRQNRRGWLQECLCCQYKSEFKYLVDGKMIAHSNEEFGACNRCTFAPHHTWDMTIKERGGDTEMLEIERPCRCYMPLCCKCCCFQEAFISSGEEDLGEIRETCYWWYVVPLL